MKTHARRTFKVRRTFRASLEILTQFSVKHKLIPRSPYKQCNLAGDAAFRNVPAAMKAAAIHEQDGIIDGEQPVLQSVCVAGPDCRRVKEASE